MTEPVWVRPSLVPAARAMPKSVTFTWPCGVRRMLPGFTSRWTTPLRWAKPSAPAMSEARSAARLGYSGPSAWIASRRLRPSTYSMTMKYVPSSSPQSKTATMLGWFRLAADCASRRKRCTKAGSRANSGKRTLSATRRSRSWSWAR